MRNYIIANYNNIAPIKLISIANCFKLQLKIQLRINAFYIRE